MTPEHKNINNIKRWEASLGKFIWVFNLEVNRKVSPGRPERPERLESLYESLYLSILEPVTRGQSRWWGFTLGSSCHPSLNTVFGCISVSPFLLPVCECSNIVPCDESFLEPLLVLPVYVTNLACIKQCWVFFHVGLSEHIPMYLILSHDNYSVKHCFFEGHTSFRNMLTHILWICQECECIQKFQILFVQ